MDQEIAAELLHELLMWFLSIQEDHIGVRCDKARPELCMIFLSHLRDLGGILFHPGPARGELPLQSKAGMPHCGELHQRELLGRCIGAQCRCGEQSLQRCLNGRGRITKHGEDLHAEQPAISRRAA